MTKKFRPRYVDLLESGELGERVSRASELLRSCTVCPRQCRVNRISDQRGFCQTGIRPVVASFGPHFGEEPPLAGVRGSGTIFITGCNMACTFCQNSDISRGGRGREITSGQLAGMMLSLQESGCHNINIVSPSHIVPQLLDTIAIAAAGGLEIPLVYNTGGYDSVETLRLLDGVIDIYMPDAKYSSGDVAAALSQAPDYPAVMKAAITEMHRQVGVLIIEQGIAARGLIIRHLVLPDNLAGSNDILPWIAEEISRDTYVNLMDQYHPAGCVLEESVHGIFPSMGRRVLPAEYHAAITIAAGCGLHRGFTKP
jgi:putative pyruvate formate lyase activating enzyme